MISIIIIVKNDIRILQLLERIKKFETRNKLETIVVDASKGLFDERKKAFKFARWVNYSTNKNSSIPQQRNLGLKNAKGNIIVFIDSDCIPLKNWLDNLVAPIKYEGEAIVAGRVIHSDHTSLHSIEFFRHSKNIYLGEAPTMNIAIKREVFDKVGNFDNKFQCGEDVDFLWRATKKGYKIRFQPSASIKHDLGNLNNEVKRMYRYGKARVNLYKKHKYKQGLFWRSEIFKIFYLLYIILLPISLLFPPYLLILVIYVIRNYKDNPIKKFIYKASCGLGMIAGIKTYYFSNFKLLK